MELAFSEQMLLEPPELDCYQRFTCVYVYLNAERLAAECGVETSELSQAVAVLTADGDRDVRYFVERVTLSATSASSECNHQ